jgi:hypothetical protein
MVSIADAVGKLNASKTVDELRNQAVKMPIWLNARKRADIGSVLKNRVPQSYRPRSVSWP